jgi:hypothetical protein
VSVGNTLAAYLRRQPTEYLLLKPHAAVAYKRELVPSELPEEALALIVSIRVHAEIPHEKVWRNHTATCATELFLADGQVMSMRPDAHADFIGVYSTSSNPVIGHRI